MILVDDRLTLEVLAGRRHVVGATDDDTIFTTWGIHYRLVRALTDTARAGQLSGPIPTDQLLHAVLAPRPSDLQVLDPRTLTGPAAAVAVRHGLNLLAAELVAAAMHHRATIALSSSNVGRAWPEVFAAEGLELRLVP